MSENQVIFAITLAITFIAAGLGVYQGIRQNIRQSKEQSQNVKQKIEAAEQQIKAESAKAESAKATPAWDLARATLESYFNRNLSQINSIYWLSVTVMFIGFGTLIWGIIMALSSSTVVVPAAIASVAGILTEFIGATFLFIYRSTIQQAVNYSKTLERMNSVGMAMQILDTMSDTVSSNDLKSNTKATLVSLLVGQAYRATDGQQPK